ncbi:SMI1/KNR4 family protein [Streptomyces sp. NPDC057302]|uniref:SMI1/KNR4 family protein n=1 Tax=Streptomyces sp. NPDC057302 TaxID=3346094 RepID=UPI00362E29E3
MASELGQPIPSSLASLLAETDGIDFDALLFFGDNGGGDQFAFVRTPERDDIFAWDHGTDSRKWIAPHLESFLRDALGSAGEDWYR